ncbi:MAG: hypothetical protein E3J23_08730 [Candidatus Stahlbacteria bacterium]|nr:MAG: hypothetical protein E3J23_08730 [Candidatus Stahlbacteria bacterium]
MYGIKIDDRLLLRESIRVIDRDSDNLTITINVVPLKGVLYLEQTLEQSCQIHLTFSKKENNILWELLKDTVNENIIDFIFNISQKWKKVFDAPPPKNITKIVKEPDGEKVLVVTGVEEKTEKYIEKEKIEQAYSMLMSFLKLIEKYDFEMITI